ncbi:MAG: ATP-binding cassette domain-containing protein [Thermodesulfobacteriota bacterium]|nr:ATP-binding cassette domain-containing protein [Thermodesulfobacteriota bacterium]
MNIVLEARDLDFSLDGRQIFQNLNFSLRRGEIYVVLGASGSGKSVLLKLFSGLLSPARGNVEIEGINLATASREALQAIRVKMGFVFQDAALISNMSIYDNVALPLRYHTGIKESEVKARVAEKMAFFEVDRQYDRSIPAQLSLGMRKRVALARALVLEPELLFLDEPASGLGAEADRLAFGVLKKYREQARASLLVATSEWLSAFTIAHRIGLLESGRIVAEGPAREMQDSLNKMKQSGSLT